MKKKLISLIALLMSVGMVFSGCNNEATGDDTTTENTSAIEETTAKKKVKKEVPKKSGRFLGSWQYSYPYKYPTDDRLAESMPAPFDVNNLPSREILFEDFDDNKLDKLTIFYGPSDAIGDGCVTLDDDDGTLCLRWRAEAGVDASPGDYFVFTCRIKGENISGTGEYRSILQVYDDNDKWLAETHTHKQKASTDWIECQHILQVPETLNDLDPPKYYNIHLQAYKKDISGTITFDDFKLSKAVFEPMETVLMTPSYKGIIKGEGGVSDISLRAYIGDGNGFYDLSEFTLKSQITDENKKVYLESTCETVTSVMDVGFSSASLPMDGDFYLETILLNKKTGEEVQRQEWMLHKRPEDFTTLVSYDDYNRVIYNGEPTLPVRVFSSTGDEYITDIIESGVIDGATFNSLSWYHSFGDDTDYRDMVKLLEENDISVTLLMGALCFGNMKGSITENKVKTQGDIRGLISTYVNNFKDLPNLFDYYVYDEENGTCYGNELAWNRKIVESLDLDHPTTCAIDNPIALRPGVYAKTSDFLGTDPYPVTGKETQDISLVYDRITQMRELNPNRPVYFIAQQFWYSGRGDLRGPNLEEFRNMYFQAICAGSCMFDNYALREARTAPSPDSTFEEEWANYTTVYGEVQKYEPIILSIEPAPYYEVEDGGEWFNHLAKRYDGKSYLFAVNNDMNEHTARFNLDGVTTVVGHYSGETYTADADGWFEIPFGKYEVEVFEFEQDDYKSAHAELVRFTLNGVNISDPTGESVIIANGVKSVEYNARISDFAQLYINGEAVESTGTLSLDGVDELTVKVVSEDGRFSSEKVYSVE